MSLVGAVPVLYQTRSRKKSKIHRKGDNDSQYSMADKKLTGLSLVIVEIYPHKILFEDVTNGYPGHRYIVIEADSDSGGYASLEISTLEKKKL